MDWADTFAMPETESVTVPRPKKKRTEEPAATSHPPPAISASHTAKPPQPAWKGPCPEERPQAAAGTSGTESPTSGGTGQEERGRSKEEEEEGRGGKEEEEGEGRGGKEEEEGEGRGREEEEEGEGRGGEETEESRGGEGRKGNAAARAIDVIARAMHFVVRAMLRIARAMPVLCLCATLSRHPSSRHPSRSSHQSQHRSSLSQSQISHKNKEVRAVPTHPVRLPRPSSIAEPTRTRRQEMSSCSAEIGPTNTATSLGGSSTAPLRSRR